MKKEMKIMIGMFLLFAILFASGVFAQFSVSSPQFSQPGTSFDYLNRQGVGAFPTFEKDQCKAGQDFIVQVNPLGCTPKVVRSDLLESQNVPVFCQLQATQVNPLIDVEAIDSISFSGETPDAVTGVGFHPARAAIRSSGNQLLNSPILENIGYAVIVLRQHESEDTMPDVVSGELTANIRYDIETAFGVGRARLSLPQLTDVEWGNQIGSYGFWNSRGFLRADSVQDNSATIGVYTNENSRFTSFNLMEGQTSSQVYLPDALSCGGGFRLRLNSVENPDTRAKFDINGEIVQIAEGDRFLDNKCVVRDISERGINKRVDVGCTTDEGGEIFELKIVPKINLKIIDDEGIETIEEYEVGDRLYRDEDRSVYLGYAGTSEDSEELEDSFVYLVSLPVHRDKLTDDELGHVNTLAKQLTYSRITGSGLIDVPLNIAKWYSGAANLIYRNLVDGENLYKVDYGTQTVSTGVGEVESPQNFLGRDIEITGFGEPLNKEFTSDEFENNFENALSDYREIISKYQNEKEVQGTEETFGRKALFEAIRVSSQTQQRKTLQELCIEYEEKYSEFMNEVDNYCTDDLKISNSEVSVHSVLTNGRLKTISFEGIYEPSFEEYGANIFIREGNDVGEASLSKNDVVYLSDATESRYVISRDVSGTGGSVNYHFRYNEFEGEWQWASGDPSDPDNEWVSAPQTSVLKENVAGSFTSSLPDDLSELVKRLEGTGFDDGRQLILNEENSAEESSRAEFIQLVNLGRDYADIRVELDSIGEGVISDTYRLRLDEGRSIGNYDLELNNVNLKKTAGVTVLPEIKQAGTKANFSFTINIEKRGIQLSDDEIIDRIEGLNDSIKKWEDTSEKLDKAVKGFNAACLAVGTTLTVKNFFSNLDGKSIARQEVMRGDGGWFEVCSDAVSRGEFSSVDECLLEHSDDVDRDVEKVHQVIQEQNAITEDNANQRIPEIRDSLNEQVVNPRDSDEVIEVSGGSDVHSALSQEGYNQGKVSLTQARDIERYQKILASNPSPELKSVAQRELYSILSDIETNSQNFATFSSLENEISDSGLNVGVNAYSDEGSIDGTYSGGTLSGNQISGISGFDADRDYPAEVIVYNNKKYLVFLEQVGGSTYTIANQGESIYRYEGVQGGKVSLSPMIPVGTPESQTSQYVSEKNRIRNKFSIFREFDRTTYQNEFDNPEVKYFETEPYKGLPSIVPFDLNNGWYAGMKQTVAGFGNLRTYDESGGVGSFYVCNVGENGRQEFLRQKSDDICRGFNSATGQSYGTFQGLSQSETDRLVNDAKQAIREASEQHGSGVRSVRIAGQNVPVGTPATSVPDVQCQDFMSPKECLLLFNSCDPVVCPSSRCDLGGTFPVDNVIQSGIVGSTALCLPNAQEGIAVPVCLTGIKAGVDGYLSVQENYRQCLQEQLETGRNIGICDEIHSIYMCDFFWSQTAPIADTLVPKLFESLTGQSGRGGGEYLGVQSAWQNAQDSVDYMTNYYGANSFDAFRTRAVEQVGSAICKNFVSASYPSDADLLDSLVEPESPPQYHAWFSEQSFSTATVPATSQYKVFYHIFAGENRGAYYSVYLQNPQGSSFFQSGQKVDVASGYIETGDFSSETREFTAPSGYQQLCVSVNGQEECGFKQVSTSFAADYFKDQYLQEQGSQTDIQSESECVSGTPSARSLINPNLQAGVSDVVNPNLYNSGIVRVCSTDNPGQGTDPQAGTENGRWLQVGTCDQGQGNLKCYLDTQSVTNVIQSTDLENRTLSEARNSVIEGLRSEGEFIEDFEGTVDEIQSLSDEEKVQTINSELISKAFYSHQKAKLLLMRGNAYANLALQAISANLKNAVGSVSSNSATSTDSENQVGNSLEDLENATRNSWTLGSALEEARTRSGDYSDNEEFIDQLHEDGILNDEEYNDINGFIGLGESDMEEVAGILEDKSNTDSSSISENAGSSPDVALPEPQDNVQRTLANDEVISDLNSYSNIISEASQEFGVEDSTIRSIILQESKAQQRATDNVGSWGLMQISILAAQDVKNRYSDIQAIASVNTNSESAFSNDVIENPRKNIYVGTAYYEILYNYYSNKGNSGDDLKKITLAAYNWGRENIRNYCNDVWNDECVQAIRNYRVDDGVGNNVLQYVSNIMEYDRRLS